MTKERLYDFMVSILTAGLIGGFVWFLTIEKKLPILENRYDVLEKKVDGNTSDIKEVKSKLDTQHKQVIEALHRIELKLENKKDRE